MKTAAPGKYRWIPVNTRLFVAAPIFGQANSGLWLPADPRMTQLMFINNTRCWIFPLYITSFIVRISQLVQIAYAWIKLDGLSIQCTAAVGWLLRECVKAVVSKQDTGLTVYGRFPDRTFPGQDVSRRTFPVHAGRFPDRMFPVHILSGNRLSAEMPLIYIIYLLSQTYCHLIVLRRDIHM